MINESEGWAKALYLRGDFLGRPVKARGAYRLSIQDCSEAVSVELGWSMRTTSNDSVIGIAAFGWDGLALECYIATHARTLSATLVIESEYGETVDFRYRVDSLVRMFSLLAPSTPDFCGTKRVIFADRDLAVECKATGGTVLVDVSLEIEAEIANVLLQGRRVLLADV